MKIAFCHHLSVPNLAAGGEKWVVNTAKALMERGHDVVVNALPFTLNGTHKNNFGMLEGIDYHEGFHHKVEADVAYVTYHPFSFLNFNLKCPKIAGFHSETYWQQPNLRYGVLPLAANIANKFVSYMGLRGFNAVHRLSNLYPVNHPKVYTVPNYVDSSVYKPIKKSDEFTVAFASRKVWQKGYDIFQEVAGHLDCRVKVSGNLDEADMPSFLSDAHVVLAPSRVDTFGLALVESMMVGTPVVTSPLASHFALGLPFRYARTSLEYLREVSKLREEEAYGFLSDVCRHVALRYEKDAVMDRIEDMFLEVAGN